ncbi:MAG: GIY-YIG nuclease family protein [Methylacidiphilales bacterium]|nr:GIY-YIG nuclease family protein [Candidatus Methylacidiphilales bacterium]
MKDYVVYILSNSAATLYIGVTSNLDERLFQHGDRHDPKSFASRYNLHRLVFVETFPTANQAIAREKQLKGWTRAKKLKLIREQNPEWRDLSADYGLVPPRLSSGG